MTALAWPEMGEADVDSAAENRENG
jgi:hypothetical protein